MSGAACWVLKRSATTAPQHAHAAAVPMTSTTAIAMPARLLMSVPSSIATVTRNVDGRSVRSAAAWACWGTVVALRFKTQQAAPLMQVLAFASILFTTAYAPEALLSDWLATIADVNPVRYILEGVRQAFVTGVTAKLTLEAFAAMIGMLLFFGGFALRGISRVGD